MSYLLVVIGLVLLVFGGDVLVQGASGIAKKFKLSPLVIGMTVVAFGTSAPELMVSVNAALVGSPEIALGNVVGSNIANLALVLAITVLIFPLVIDRNSKIIDWPVMFLSSILFVIFALNGLISRWEGLLFFISIVVFTTFIIRNSRKKIKAAGPVPDEEIPNVYLSLGRNLLGLVLLYFGSDWLVQGAIDIAQDFGVEERIIGVTVIAFGTSVPELAASIMAAIKKETDISLGNLIGSNIFNILTVIGITAMVKPIPVSGKIINPDMIWMVGIALLFGFFLTFWKKINRFHGFLLLLSYLAYLATILLSQETPSV
jgi:cation:H+ antiporter